MPQRCVFGWTCKLHTVISLNRASNMHEHMCSLVTIPIALFHGFIHHICLRRFNDAGSSRRTDGVGTWKGWRHTSQCICPIVVTQILRVISQFYVYASYCSNNSGTCPALHDLCGDLSYAWFKFMSRLTQAADGSFF